MSGVLPFLFLMTSAFADSTLNDSLQNLGSTEVHAASVADWKDTALSKVLPLGDSIRDDDGLGLQRALQKQLGFTETMYYQAPLLLRGLSGNRILVSRDGLRQENSYPAGYMIHSENVGALGVVHLEKGMGSVRYGSGAIAGTIDLGSVQFVPEARLESRLSAGYGTNAKDKNLSDRFLWTRENLGLQLYVRGRWAENYHYAQGEVAENTDLQEKDGAWDLEWRLDDHQKIRYDGSVHRGGPFGKPRGFTGTWYLIARTPSEDIDRHVLSYEWLGKG
ncbi:MAG TPA: TonB-dependent receptor plug domain-containing protein, partial [Fibrobacteraceae bacterium]|nr:TonB-dependent receptor plug domain-containing protein [Fibrobacteraceae bacterium]